MSGSFFKPLLGPASHHTSKAHDPILPDVTSGGDGGEPATARERVWIIPVAMVLVLVAGIAAVWWLLSRGDEASAASLADSGVTINDRYADVVAVEDLGDGRFTLKVQDDADAGTVATTYVLATEDAMPTGDAWQPYTWPGVEAAVSDSEYALALSDGNSSWRVTNSTAAVAGAEGEALAAGWAQLEQVISLDAG